MTASTPSGEARVERLLSGKRAIVTGGGRGLGLAAALSLAVDGAAVMVVGRSKDPLAGAAARLREIGAIASFCAADLARPESATEVVERTLAELGGIDVLVNNAGVFVWKRFLDMPREDFERTLAVNLAAPYFLSQAAARAMARQNTGGSIIHISSIHGRVGEANLVPHCAAKAGLIGMTQAMAEALREHDIRVNAICPGAIQSDSADRRSASPREKATQADVATLIVYLASDLSRAITGAALDVHGATRLAIKT